MFTFTRDNPNGNYVSVNGLNIYYETHGSGGMPLVLLHGAFSGIQTSFGALLPGLSQTRQVIAVELQAHGRTADIDRPLTVGNMAEDVAALLRHLGHQQADIFGYSMGAAVALELTLRYPELVRKAIFTSLSYKKTGTHPELQVRMGDLQPEQLFGSPFHDEYMSIAPNPDNFATLVRKVDQMNQNVSDWDADALRAITAPVLVMIGDSDIIQPEHAVEMFRLFGGGVVGDLVGLPKSQLAIVPGATHVTVVYQTDVIVPIVTRFLDSSVAE